VEEEVVETPAEPAAVEVRERDARGKM